MLLLTTDQFCAGILCCASCAESKLCVVRCVLLLVRVACCARAVLILCSPLETEHSEQPEQACSAHLTSQDLECQSHQSSQ